MQSCAIAVNRAHYIVAVQLSDFVSLSHFCFRTDVRQYVMKGAKLLPKPKREIVDTSRPQAGPRTDQQ
ncbi:hypothetical protein Y032_0373g185 [Ancylostoma ceylanicum]|uniref:Uncharacterized protein n=1 Tax=Ancylostoma ceylanicum TaxID=53326 RepID=A0A016RV25_9BILA|nr:hypothetical protein Y032_0373g185 [Ancylostoma ceylanicum]